MEPKTGYMCCICDGNTIILTQYQDSSAPISFVSLVSNTHREISKWMGITIQLTLDKQEQLIIRARNKVVHTSHLVPFLDKLMVEKKAGALPSVTDEI